MIRSAAPSSSVRAALYAVTALCLLGYAFMLLFVFVGAGFAGGSDSVILLALVALSVAVMVAGIVAAIRRDDSGGYALVAAAAVVGTAICVVGVAALSS